LRGKTPDEFKKLSDKENDSSISVKAKMNDSFHSSALTDVPESSRKVSKNLSKKQQSKIREKNMIFQC